MKFRSCTKINNAIQIGQGKKTQVEGQKKEKTTECKKMDLIYGLVLNINEESGRK